MPCFRRWRSSHQMLETANTRSAIWRTVPPLRSPRAIHRRHLGLESIPPVLLPPTVFGGLLVTLWAYKCLMMVVFQNKIIYMPSVPPFSRSEKVSDYARQCHPVIWTEHDLRAADGTALKLLEGSIGARADTKPREHVVVLYLQGYVEQEGRSICH